VGEVSKNPETRPWYFLKVIACTTFQGSTFSRSGGIGVFRLNCIYCHALSWEEFPKILKYFLDIFLMWLRVLTFKVLPSPVPEILRFLQKIALTATPTYGRNLQKSWNTSLIFFYINFAHRVLRLYLLPCLRYWYFKMKSH